MDLLGILAFTALFLIAVSIFLVKVIRRNQWALIAESENRFDRKGERLKGIFPLIFIQKKLLLQLFAGIMHFIIFWGFLFIALKTLEHVFIGYTGYNFSFLGFIYPLFRGAIDVISFLVLVVVIIGMLRWLVFTPKRLRVAWSSRLEGTLILFLIAFLVLTMYIGDASEIRLAELSLSPVMSMSDSLTLSWIPFTAITHNMIDSFKPEFLVQIWHICWWAHIIAILGFLILIPGSKHFHLVTIWFNVFFRDLRGIGNLRALDLEDEERENFGASEYQNFSWKQLLDTYTCTHCGRCTDVCPANRTGKPLDPKKIHTNLRDHVEKYGPEAYQVYKTAFAEAKNKDENKGKTCTEIHKTLKPEYPENPIIPLTYTEDEIWSCTTCGACEYECPVNNEHISKIVDVRRSLVMEESKFPEPLTNLFKNVEVNGSPWAVNFQDRTKWAEGLDVKTIEDNPDFEILWWVGCAPSIDPRAQKIAQAFLKILQTAGVNYAILGNAEKCCGDPVRKTGSEDRFQMLVEENVETLNEALGEKMERRIVTTCPHGLNMLKMDYREFGGEYNVIFHADLILELIESGKLKLNGAFGKKVIYHDSCYLGRYNEIYEAPRKIIELATGGEKVREFSENHGKSLCCGAGGGWNWMEETIGKRINVERTEQALQTDAEVIASACPFCLTMFEDACKALNKDEEITRFDIAEIIAQVIE